MIEKMSMVELSSPGELQVGKQYFIEVYKKDSNTETDFEAYGTYVGCSSSGHFMTRVFDVGTGYAEICGLLGIVKYYKVE